MLELANRSVPTEKTRYKIFDLECNTYGWIDEQEIQLV
jgi:hypothetical protein